MSNAAPPPYTCNTHTLGLLSLILFVQKRQAPSEGQIVKGRTNVDERKMNLKELMKTAMEQTECYKKIQRLVGAV